MGQCYLSGDNGLSSLGFKSCYDLWPPLVAPLPCVVFRSWTPAGRPFHSSLSVPLPPPFSFLPSGRPGDFSCFKERWRVGIRISFLLRLVSFVFVRSPPSFRSRSSPFFLFPPPPPPFCTGSSYLALLGGFCVDFTLENLGRWYIGLLFGTASACNRIYGLNLWHWFVLFVNVLIFLSVTFLLQFLDLCNSVTSSCAPLWIICLFHFFTQYSPGIGAV